MQKSSRKCTVMLWKFSLELKKFVFFLLRVWDESKFGRIFVLGARDITKSSCNKGACCDNKANLYTSTPEIWLNITGMKNSSATLTPDQWMWVADNKLCNSPPCYSVRLPSGAKCFRLYIAHLHHLREDTKKRKETHCHVCLPKNWLNLQHPCTRGSQRNLWLMVSISCCWCLADLSNTTRATHIGCSCCWVFSNDYITMLTQVEWENRASVQCV